MLVEDAEFHRDLPAYPLHGSRFGEGLWSRSVFDFLSSLLDRASRWCSEAPAEERGQEARLGPAPREVLEQRIPSAKGAQRRGRRRRSLRSQPREPAATSGAAQTWA